MLGMVVAAVAWHWWIAPLLVAGAVGLVVSTIIGYVNKVVKPQYDPNKK